MAVHTILKEKEVINFLNNYNLNNFKKHTGITEGIENTNYLIETISEKFILTIFEERVEEKDLPFYFELMDHSFKHGINCPRAIVSKNNNRLINLKGKKCSLFTFIEGKCINQWNEKNCYDVGSVLGKFHNVNSIMKIKKKNDYDIYGWKTLLEKCSHDMNSVIPNSYDTILNELSFLEKTWPDKLPKGIIHADLFPDNVLFLNNTISGIIDFYFSSYDLFVYDLAVLINSWCFKDEIFNKKKCLSILNGYEINRKLLAEEKIFLNICLRGASVRFFMTRMYDLLFTKKKKNLIHKNPLEYLIKLKFHQSIRDFSDYVQ